jgi:hypothetical protein
MFLVKIILKVFSAAIYKSKVVLLWIPLPAYLLSSLGKNLQKHPNKPMFPETANECALPFAWLDTHLHQNLWDFAFTLLCFL